ncbi:hypothetical protein C8J56DRAFT_895438 [Mycena floridula]|nr:hypothetical protein C8J56DRAFT_895438 [Mycena floridula]
MDSTSSHIFNGTFLQGKAITNLRPTTINDERRDERDEELTASATNTSETSSLPILTPSPSTASQAPIIPDSFANSTILIHDFIRKQKNWFVAKDIKAADKAKWSFVAFSNNRKLDKYIDNNNARLAAMEFEPFVADLRGYALEEDWMKKVLTELMSKKLRRGASFATHSQDVVYLNRLLKGTAEHQTDIQMRSHVTASLPSELHEHTFNIIAATYDEWSGALVKLIKKDYDLGKRLALANPTLTATIQNVTPSILQPAFQYSNQNQQLNQNQHLTPFTNARSSMPYPNQNAPYSLHSNFPSSQQRNQEHPQQRLSWSLWATTPFNQSFSNNYRSGPCGPLQQVDKRAPNYDWPPYLQPTEREVLMELRGCLGCQRVDVPPGHQANNCDTPEHLCPHGSDYQPVTQESAMQQLQKRPRETNNNPNFISLSAPAPKRLKPIISVVLEESIV